MAHEQEAVGSYPGTIQWMEVSILLAITLWVEKLKIKVAKWATKKNNFF